MTVMASDSEVIFIFLGLFRRCAPRPVRNDSIGNEKDDLVFQAVWANISNGASNDPDSSGWNLSRFIGTAVQQSNK